MNIFGFGSSALNTAVSEAVKLLNRAETRLLQATYEVGVGDIVDAAILMRQGKVEARVATAIIRTADEMSGTILDILA